MSNNYLMFSTRLKNATLDEILWWKTISVDGVDIVPINDHIDLIAEENGNVDALADYIQKFLLAFRPKQAVILSYSRTCDKPIADEFGGGAVAVTSDGQKWFDPARQAAEYLGEIGYDTDKMLKE
jgi:hypothetical protein